MMLRLSSNPDEEMTADRCEAWLTNNRIFHHQFNPYFERKDIKKSMIGILLREKDPNDLNQVVKDIISKNTKKCKHATSDMKA